MKPIARLGLVLLSAGSLLLTAARAQENRDRGERKPARNQQQQRPVRAPPPKFQAHPPGVHPQGPTVRQHPVRVLAPKVITRRGGGWAHWDHPDFQRPAYYWNWRVIHNVTCTAEDSYGDQYPVNETVWRGFGLTDLTKVEDDALDRCYAESGQDNTCYLLTCTHS